MRNRIKEKLQAGGTAIGAWMSTYSIEATRALVNSGLDWILYDLEHGPCEIETVNRLMYHTSGGKAIPIIRVVWNDVNAIKRALDSGAYGIVVPWVSTKEDAIAAVRYSKYPPDGIRGAAPSRPAKIWGIEPNEYLRSANNEVLVIVQIEREEAVNNIEEILSVEGVDATFIGPTDLSNSMGFTGKPFNPRGVKAMDKVLEACQNSGVAPGIAYASSTNHAKELISQGFRFIGIGSEVGFLLKGCQDTINAL